MECGLLLTWKHSTTDGFTSVNMKLPVPESAPGPMLPVPNRWQTQSRPNPWSCIRERTMQGPCLIKETVARSGGFILLCGWPCVWDCMGAMCGSLEPDSLRVWEAARVRLHRPWAQDVPVKGICSMGCHVTICLSLLICIKKRQRPER